MSHDRNQQPTGDPAGYAFEITFETKRGREPIMRALDRVTQSGPFQVASLDHLSPDWWVATIRRADPAVMVGFAKVAEVLTLLAREFEIHGVQRTSRATGAVAS